MKIKLYSQPGCGMCNTIKRMLQLKHIEYEDCEDTEVMKKLGITHPPVLEVDGTLLQGTQIRDWLSQQ